MVDSVTTGRLTIAWGVLGQAGALKGGRCFITFGGAGILNRLYRIGALWESREFLSLICHNRLTCEVSRTSDTSSNTSGVTAG
jgi:hypothetical protein